MARRWLLGEAAQARLVGLPADEREVIRYATLGPENMALVAERRGEANQLGFALMLVCLRHPGRVLEADEVPPPVLLLHLARQLDVDAGAFATYARRDQTRRAHLAELTRWLGLRAFDRAAFRAMIAWALPLAPTMRDPEALATLLVEELRYRQILAPSIAVLELIVRAALRRAERPHEGALKTYCHALRRAITSCCSPSRSVPRPGDDARNRLRATAAMSAP